MAPHDRGGPLERPAADWRKLCVWLALAVGFAAPLAASGAATFELAAQGVEFLRFDPSTGAPLARVSARSARSSGAGAALETVAVASWGEGVLEVSSASGSFELGAGAVLSGGVEAVWRGEGSLARLQTRELAWDEPTRTFRTAGEASGELAGTLAGKDPPKGLRVVFSGTGLAAAQPTGRLRIERAAALCIECHGLAPWLIEADGGMEIEALGGARPVLRLAGPLAAGSRGVWASAEAAELHLREEAGALVLARVYATGLVRVRVGAEARLGAGLEGPAELRGEALEFWPAEFRAVLLGSPRESACASLRLGELRGARLELSAGRVASDGGAVSEMGWGRE